MKKSFACILLVLLVCAALAACGDASGKGVIGATPPPATPSPLPSASVSLPPVPDSSAAPGDGLLPDITMTDGTAGSTNGSMRVR